MIRCPVSRAKLESLIAVASPNWFADAETVSAGLPSLPSSSDFKPLWTRIKQIYIDLQNSKCCFCEKPLEGRIEQDVEHFRPKAEVRSWVLPAKLTAEGISVRQPEDGSPEQGYARLAYHPFNYAMSCKTCNSTFKGNLFPIEGVRQIGHSDPRDMQAEKALLIYPIGAIDTNPEGLIRFDALSPVPEKKRGRARRRAVVTIELFQLDTRPDLIKQRAYLLRLLYLELEWESRATAVQQRADHSVAIAALTSPESPFTNCMRCFADLYRTNKARARTIAKECIRYLASKSH